MKPAKFDYHVPKQWDELLDHLQHYGDEARILAGGQSLVPAMNFRLARPDVLLDINRIADLDYVSSDADRLHIGALARHAAFERPTGDGPLDRLLSQVVRSIAHAPIRTRGTFVGSIAHADPAAEWCMVASVLDAEMVCARLGQERCVPACDFFRGVCTTALDDDEALREVRLPQLDPRWSTGFAEFSRRAGDFAVAMAAVLVRLDQGKIQESRIAIGGVSDRPLRRAAAEAVLLGQEPSTELIAQAAALSIEGIDPMSDIHASAVYRRDVAQAMTRRALMQALASP